MFLQLLERRVPQLVGLYLGASWGLIEFSSFAVGQFALSPAITNLVVLALVLLLPAVVMLAWRHGAPGTDAWTKVDGVAIGLNLVVAAGVLFAVFGGETLGAATTVRLVEDAEGNTVERVLPKAEFRRSVLLYSFDNETGDPALDWLQTGITFGVVLDLIQDVFITAGLSSNDPTVKERLAEAGFGVNDRIPLSLKREAAERRSLPNFLAGTVRREGPTLVVETRLYETRSARELAARTYRGQDPLALADQISVDLRRDLGIPDWQIEESPDLPAAELATTSPRGYETFIEAQSLIEASDHAAGRVKSEAAIALDSTFALAYSNAAVAALIAGDREGGGELITAANRYLYRLPERQRLAIQLIDKWLFQQDPQGALRAARYWTEVYPQDAEGRRVRVTLASITGNQEETIAQARALLAIDSADVQSMRQLATAFRQDLQYDSALAYYERLGDRLPTDVRTRLDVAAARISLGGFEEARAELERAATAAPADPDPIAALARLDMREGEYADAIERVAHVGQLARTPQERSDGARLEETLFYTRGQFDRLQDAYRRRLAAQREFAPHIVVMGNMAGSEALRFATEAGRGDWALQQIDSLQSLAQEPFSLFLESAAVRGHLARGDVPAARASLDGLGRMREELGTDRGSEALIAWVEGRIAEFEDGDCTRALVSYERALELAPLNSNYRVSHLACLVETKRWPQAEREVNWLLARRPGSAKARVGIARYYAARDRTDEAISHLEYALDVWSEADSDYVPAREARALLTELRRS
jgi:tetratricopeptide (TPR) repeat protein/TolB-like protein